MLDRTWAIVIAFRCIMQMNNNIINIMEIILSDYFRSATLRLYNAV